MEDQSVLDIEPQSPPKPSLHPKAKLIHHLKPDSKSVALAEPVVDQAAPRPRLRQLNSSLLIDPRYRDKLASRLRPARPEQSSSVLNPDTTSAFHKPELNSSLALKMQLQCLEMVKISEEAAATRISADSIRGVQTKLTKTLNASSKDREYMDLLPLSTNTTLANTRIPRAKSSIDDHWRTSKEDSPHEVLESIQEKLQTDSISVPYPQLSYNNYQGHPINPSLSISSFALNLDDSLCSDFMETPLVASDFT